MFGPSFVPLRPEGNNMLPETLSTADALAIPYARICLVLGLTILVTLVVGVALRRFLQGGRASVGRKGSRFLALVDALPIGPGRAVYAVEAQGRTLVFAATGDRVALLAEIDPMTESTTASDALGAVSVPPPASRTVGLTGSFSRVLEAARRFETDRGETRS
jgi:flagellar biogenesis protein FliO